jgi:glycosyltransferase involved in cell wall biosynthesis
MHLTIVIPALNEEQSIASIIQQCIDASKKIIENTSISNVTITVVSDGSTDKTVEIAQRFIPHIKLIIFKENKGYGAAIKKGWEQSDADLLAFIDADGTCNPLFFIELIKSIEQSNADVAIGCRINPKSKMPFIRKLGNIFFSRFLAFVSRQKVKDTASGMRVIKKTALNKLYPLPDGLHFTPAMSTRAMLAENINIIEIDMPYMEREGKSKLSVIKDGLRFFAIMLQLSFIYQPKRLLSLPILILTFVSIALMLNPVLFYMQNKMIEDWMIYRFIVAEIFMLGSFLLIGLAHIASKISAMNVESIRQKKDAYHYFFNTPIWLIVSALFLLIGISFVFDSLRERIITGHTNEHWSRYISMSFFTASAIIIFIIKMLDVLLITLNEKFQFLKYKTRT